MLSGGEVASVVAILEDDVVASVEGLTLTDGAGTEVEIAPGFMEVHGGAVACLADGELTVTNSRVVDSEALHGGGIAVDDGCSLAVQG